MQKFTTKIVNMMKAERLYQTQGGPIILSQVVQLLCSPFYFLVFMHQFIHSIQKVERFVFYVAGLD